eukprot:TRINITY_DN24018_c0_g1_i1.p1 TRINITY_DN24018_c0_g1~~TRINITY_DN24018_c0_g1_i1.p1  ORF type:complete len:339 (-),score=5.74 TRINITY_DN24018_c0_g1_i1:83-1099(-)
MPARPAQSLPARPWSLGIAGVTTFPAAASAQAAGSCTLAATTATAKYYYHSTDDLDASRAPLPIPDANVFAGLFELGPRIGAGEFGHVYRLIRRPDSGVYGEYVLKVSRELVDHPPYLMRKSIGNGVYLYIVTAAKPQAFEDRCHYALKDLAHMHRTAQRTHGDVNPGNMLTAVSVDRVSARLDPLSQTAGWDSLLRTSYGHLIDPDLSCRFGERKRISRVLHEDPRTELAGPLDDLIGLLHSILLHCGVSVTRTGGFAYSEACDFVYGCAMQDAAPVWRWICAVYYSLLVQDMANPDSPRHRRGLFDRLERSAQSGEQCLMSWVLQSASPHVFSPRA